MTSQPKALGSSLERRVVKRATAKGLRAKKQPLSGVLADFPHDVVIERLLVECKVRSTHTTMKGETQFTIPIAALREVQDAARKSKDFDQGILVVNPKGSSNPFVVCDLDWFLTLLTRGLDTAQSIVHTDSA